MLNWSELDHDLLVEIAQHIKKLEDFIVFGAVCKAWYIAGNKENFKGLWLRQGTPYLMLPVKDENDDCREFYSLVEGKIVDSVIIPQFKERKCYESLGWLLAVEDDGSMCLLDTFSSVEIPVPHQRTFPVYSNLTLNAYAFVQKMALSSRPSESSDFILMIIGGGGRYLAFWRPGDELWNKIKFQNGYYADIMYHGGHFFAFDFQGYAWVVTFEGNNPPESRMITRLVADYAKVYINELILPPPFLNTNELVDYKNLYILKTSVSLFMITRTMKWFHDDENLRRFYYTTKFQVYEVDMSAGTWVEINNIGSMAIFVGLNATFAVDTSRFFGKIKGNHIYFTDNGQEAYYFPEPVGGGKDMGAYNMATRKTGSIFSGEVLYTKVCPSIWITPSF